MLRFSVVLFTTLCLLIGPVKAQQNVTINCWTGANAFPCTGLSISSTIVANNTTSVVVKAAPGLVYQVDAYANGTSSAYVKLYDALTATCGSGTPKARYLIPYGTSSTGGGFIAPQVFGDLYTTGIVLCVTTGIADNDTGSPAASTFIVNVHYK